MTFEADMQDIFGERKIGPALIVEGFGTKLRVERGQLIIEDGFGPHRRTTKLPRIEREVKRIIVTAPDGYISVDAIQWCRDVGKSLVVLDTTGDLLLSSDAGHNNARIRRAQAAEPIEVARHIITQKLLSQYEVCGLWRVKECAREVQGANTVEEVRGIEAVAARAYWTSLKGTTLNFGSDQVQEHWRSFQRRNGPLAGQRNVGRAKYKSPRKAIDPMNAMLNLAYAICENESKLVCLAVGLDPALGIIHQDRPWVWGMAHDLMEVARPAIDSLILDFIKERTFSRKYFAETKQGQCIVCPPLTHELISKASAISRPVLAKIGEEIADILTTKTRTKVKTRGKVRT